MMLGEELSRVGAAIAPLVYLVEDDDDLREEMVFGLSNLGLTVQGFPSAAALYRAYAVRVPDVVVLDIGIGEENGFTVASHLRASPSLGIIMATARGSMTDRMEAIER